MGIRYVDGQRFRRAVVAGADWVRHMREHLNRINVFPVADGDTGTNMALSLSATAQAARESEEKDLAAASQQVAEASILGAKGNSGLILAHWFLGLSRAMHKKTRVTGDELAQAMHHATQSVYDAIDEPVEGTILTVMRESSTAGREAAHKGQDVREVLEEIIAAAEAALARTPEMLKVLRDANVVDAGAQGFVHFLHGVRRALDGDAPPEISEEEIHEAVTHPPISAEEISERFCTEVVVRGRNFDPELLRARFSGMGSSMLLATTGEVFKLHIHTDHPDEVFRAAARWGKVEERKVDDMLRQSQERGGASIPPIVPLDEQPNTVAIVCDSTADLPLELRRELGVEMAPLQVLFGDEVYRDQIDLSTDQFYRKLVEDPHHPTTSQPPPREFVEAFERIRSDREVLVITVSAGLSGTHRSALSAVALAHQKRVEVFDSHSASMGHGLQVINAARLAQAGARIDEILGHLECWRSNTGLVFTVSTLEFLRRGGRIGRAQQLLGSLLNLRPVLTFEEGEVRPVSKGRGEADSYEKLLAEIQRRIPAGSRIRLGLCGGVDDAVFTMVEGRLRAHCELVDVSRGDLTGVVGAHTGPRVLGVFYQIVLDDDPLDGVAPTQPV